MYFPASCKLHNDILWNAPLCAGYVWGTDGLWMGTPNWWIAPNARLSVDDKAGAWQSGAACVVWDRVWRYGWRSPRSITVGTKVVVKWLQIVDINIRRWAPFSGYPPRTCLSLLLILERVKLRGRHRREQPNRDRYAAGLTPGSHAIVSSRCYSVWLPSTLTPMRVSIIGVNFWTGTLAVAFFNEGTKTLVQQYQILYMSGCYE